MVSLTRILSVVPILILLLEILTSVFVCVKSDKRNYYINLHNFPDEFKINNYILNIICANIQS